METRKLFIIVLLVCPVFAVAGTWTLQQAVTPARTVCSSMPSMNTMCTFPLTQAIGLNGTSGDTLTLVWENNDDAGGEKAITLDTVQDCTSAQLSGGNCTTSINTWTVQSGCANSLCTGAMGTNGTVSIGCATVYPVSAGATYITVTRSAPPAVETQVPALFEFSTDTGIARLDFVNTASAVTCPTLTCTGPTVNMTTGTPRGNDVIIQAIVTVPVSISSPYSATAIIEQHYGWAYVLNTNDGTAPTWTTHDNMRYSVVGIAVGWEECHSSACI
jgi:hypothetical protein